MPNRPSDDGPLRDPGFPPATPAAAQTARRAHPGIEKRTNRLPPEVVAQMEFDPASVERPPRPQSSFETPADDPFSEVQSSTTASDEPKAASNAASTSTFVAAARRAQRAKQESTPSVMSNSIIGRALARVKANTEEEDTPDAASASDVEASGQEVVRKKRSLFARKPKVDRTPKSEQAEIAEAEMPTDQTPETPTKAGRFLGRRKEPKMEAAESVAQDQLDPTAPEHDFELTEDDADSPSFLMRYRRTLLLAAALAVVSMLALNLVLQRGGSADSTASPPDTGDATPAKTSMLDNSVDLATLPTEPRVISMVDSSTVGSIDPANTTRFSKTTSDMPPIPSAMAANALTSPETESAIADDLKLTSPILANTGDLANPAAAPNNVPAATEVVEFELAPESVGPLPLREAAAKGDARAQFEIGAIYSEGHAITQDYSSAATWYERAAAQGFAPAQYRLGNLYENGNGVEKNIEQAKLWYQRSAEAGNRMAMHNLAALYASGQLGDQKFDMAAEWFERAANRDMIDSQFNLGMLHARGLGVKQDLKASYKWFSLAARNGDADAIKARDDIARSLEADAVKEVSAEVATWKPTDIDLAANFAPIGTWSASFDPGETIKTKGVVSKVQTALLNLGFDIGTPDGVVGPKTADAIKAFERETGMSETGAINPRLLAVLGSQPV
ncbi:SEL1-like repeat protein [Devosia algicola]|uniref:SEL1-like repeat protein n=1 Tax=Devosia algicola TaxID=3026418 RepID=A0ABY7YMT5_9HYPH|nr:SEL1-like repeat protein [Devosia algicola]WDR02621.1 SEL1-like repeat protein [Devosia algicola]